MVFGVPSFHKIIAGSGHAPNFPWPGLPFLALRNEQCEKLLCTEEPCTKEILKSWPTLNGEEIRSAITLNPFKERDFPQESASRLILPGVQSSLWRTALPDTGRTYQGILTFKTASFLQKSQETTYLQGMRPSLLFQASRKVMVICCRPKQTANINISCLTQLPYLEYWSTLVFPFLLLWNKGGKKRRFTAFIYFWSAHTSTTPRNNSSFFSFLCRGAKCKLHFSLLTLAYTLLNVHEKNKWR